MLWRERPGRCDNHLTIRRDEVEARVLRALQEKLLQQDLFEEFCDELTREMMLDDEIAVDDGKAELRRLMLAERSCRRDSRQQTSRLCSCTPRWQDLPHEGQ